jgi:hypothetical protein
MEEGAENRRGADIRVRSSLRCPFAIPLPCIRLLFQRLTRTKYEGKEIFLPAVCKFITRREEIAEVRDNGLA